MIPTVYQNAYNKLKFDELNVTGAREHARDLYAMLTKINRMAFKRIIKRAYLAAAIEARAAGYRPPPDDTKEREKATTAVFLALIMAYNPVTEYKYDSEADRKRDRYQEAILARPGALDVKAASDKACRSWWTQTSQYTDLAVDAARLAAFKAAGMESVMWVSEHDERVCRTCESRDGTIYPLAEVPPKPHYRCRCWLCPVAAKTK